MAEDGDGTTDLAVSEEVAIGEISVNTWNGSDGIFHLREFDTVTSEEKGALSWSQTMGTVTIWYDMSSHFTGTLTQDDIAFELSTWEIKVAIGAGSNTKSKAKINDLCIEFARDIIWERSWWVIEDKEGEKWMKIMLYKLDHREWDKLNWDGPMNPHRRQGFHWSAIQMEIAKNKATGYEKLLDKPSGRPSSVDNFVCSPDFLVIHIDESQELNTVSLRVYLDEETLKLVHYNAHSLETLFAADIGPESFKLWIRGYAHAPIIEGKLAGVVIPQETGWAIVRTDPLYETKDMWAYSLALQIDFVKTDGSFNMWPSIFSECQKCEFMSDTSDGLKPSWWWELVEKQKMKMPPPPGAQKQSARAGAKKTPEELIAMWEEKWLKIQNPVNVTEEDPELVKNRVEVSDYVHLVTKEKGFLTAVSGSSEPLPQTAAWNPINRPNYFNSRVQAMRGFAEPTPAMTLVR